MKIFKHGKVRERHPSRLCYMCFFCSSSFVVVCIFVRHVVKTATCCSRPDSIEHYRRCHQQYHFFCVRYFHVALHFLINLYLSVRWLRNIFQRANQLVRKRWLSMVIVEVHSIHFNQFQNPNTKYSRLFFISKVLHWTTKMYAQ